MDDDPRIAQQRLTLFLCASLSLLVAACLAAFLLILRLHDRAIPRLEPTGSIAEALGWPWKGFPQITETERGTFLREIGMGMPFTENRPPETRLPSPENLPSTAVRNDRLAAYLATPAFHDCGERPARAPRCAELLPTSSCFHRDFSFCRSRERAVEPFAKPFANLFQSFYTGDAWAREHLLWAMTVAVDAGSDASSIDDPHLLANLGLLSAALGDFESASAYLEAALDTSGNQEDIAEVNEMVRRSKIYSILAGRSLRTLVRDESEPSLFREVFWKLYQDDGPALRLEFPATGDGETRALLDRWLFIRLWRKLLADGEFERFTHEYDRLMRERGLFKDFFREWHDEVLTDLGQQALRAANNLDLAGENDRARAVRVFLSDNTHFPSSIRSSARSAEGWSGWILWAGKQAWLWLAATTLLLIVTLATVYCLGMIRLHRTTFFSFHRGERLGDEA